MTPAPARIDLVVLTADKNAQFAVRGVLSRAPALGIRPLAADYYIHPGKDPGVVRGAHDFLRPFTRVHARALVVMDREGSGQEGAAREEMERRIEGALANSGWGTRAAAVVIDPELDVWVWSASPHVEHELGWTERQPALRTWLRQQGWLGENEAKPGRPKEALEAALRLLRKPRSSALYQALARKVSLASCTDEAFVKLRTVLREWFSET